MAEGWRTGRGGGEEAASRLGEGLEAGEERELDRGVAPLMTDPPRDNAITKSHFVLP